MSLNSLSVSGKGADGRDYRVDVNGGGTSVQASDTFFKIEKGDNGARGLDPIWPSTLTLEVLDVDVEDLFGKPDRSVVVEVLDVTDGTDTVAWRGFMVTDFFGDSPYETGNRVKIQATDGLGTLENDSLGEIYSSSDSYKSVVDGITLILSGLGQLHVEYGAHWYPRNALSSSDCPLEFVGFNPNNYRGDRPRGPWQNQLSVLRDLLTTHGLTVRQARRPGGAVWHVRQRDAIASDGSLKVWTFNTAVDQIDLSTIDISESLGVQGSDLLREHSRDFERREQSLVVKHNHTEIAGLIKEGSFEDQGAEWTLSSGTYLTSEVENHDNVSKTQNATSGNTYLLKVTQDRFDPVNEGIREVARQPGPQLGEAPPRSSLRFKVRFHDNFKLSNSFGSDVATRGLGGLLRIELDQDGTLYTLNNRYVELSEGYTKGPNEISLESLDRFLPKGTRYPVTNKTDSEVVKAWLTVEEFAEKGATRVRGELSSGVKKGWYLVVPVLGGGDTWLSLRNWNQGDSWENADLAIPLQNGSGDQVAGNLTYKFGFRLKRDSSIVEDFNAYFDEIEVSLVGPDNSALTETVTQGSVPELGERESQTVRVTSGPTGKNIARLQGQDPSGSSYDPTEWGLGAGHSNTLPLAALKIRQRLKYWRQHAETLQVTALAWNGAPRLSGDELVTLDGKTYTIQSATYRAGDGEIDLSLVQWEEYPDSNLTLTRRIQEGEAGAGSASGSYPVGGAISGSTPQDGSLAVDIDDNSLAEVDPLGFLQIKRNKAGVISSPADGELDFDVGELAARTVDEVIRGTWTYTSKLTVDAILEQKGDANLRSALLVEGTSTLSETHITGDLSKLGVNKTDPVYSIDTANSVRAEGDVLAESDAGHPQHVDKRARWNVYADGRADFRSLFVDELVAKKFTVDVTQALAGSDVLVKSTSTLAAPATIIPNYTPLETLGGNQLETLSGDPLETLGGDPLETLGGNPLETQSGEALEAISLDGEITVEDLPGATGLRVFEPQDWVRMRYYDNSGGGKVIRDVWGVVTNYTDNQDGTQTWDIDYALPADDVALGATIGENSQVLDYGQIGQGIIRRTVEGSAAPYVAVETWTEGNSPRKGSNFDTGAILGNLDGAPKLDNGGIPKGYGLYAGNAYIEGEIVATEGKIRDSVVIGSTDAQSVSNIRTDINSITDDFLQNGTTIISNGVVATDLVVADSIKTNTITANEIQVEDLFAENINVDGVLTMDSGTITNNDGSYQISKDGLSLLGKQTGASSVKWLVGGSNVFSSGTVKAKVFTQALKNSNYEMNINAVNGANMSISADGYLNIYAGLGDRVTIGPIDDPISISTDSDTGPAYIQMNHSGSEEPDDPGFNKLKLFAREDSNGNTRLYYTAGNSGKIVGPLS